VFWGREILKGRGNSPPFKERKRCCRFKSGCLHFKKMEKTTDSLIKIMSDKEIEEEFIKKLSIVFFNLCKIMNLFFSKRGLPTREISFTLIKELEGAETFLDDYGAYHNKKFVYLRELVASMRWLNVALFHSLHILVRIESYKLQLKEEEKSKFLKDLKENIEFYFTCIKKLIKEFKKEIKKLGIKTTNKKLPAELVLPKIQKKILPPDIDTNPGVSEGNQVLNFLVKFLGESENLNFFVYKKAHSENLTEENFEKFRSSFNQLE